MRKHSLRACDGANQCVPIRNVRVHSPGKRRSEAAITDWRIGLSAGCSFSPSPPAIQRSNATTADRACSASAAATTRGIDRFARATICAGRRIPKLELIAGSRRFGSVAKTEEPMHMRRLCGCLSPQDVAGCWHPSSIAMHLLQTASTVHSRWL